MVLCPHCRNALPETPARYCPNCGGDVERAGPASSGGERSSTTGAGDGSAPPPGFSPPSPPAGGGPPPLPPGGGGGASLPPWEERDRLGFVGALVETTKRVLGEPTAFFRAMPTTGGLGAPLLYAIVIGWIGVVAAGFYSALFQSIVGSGMSSFGENPRLAEALGFLQSWGGFLAQVVFAPVVITISVFIATGVFHVMLLLLGGAQRDFEATFRVVSYAQAPAIVMVVPFCGNLIAWIWSLVLYVIGISEAQGVGRGKAAAAVLLPLLLLCCCCVLLGVLFAGAIGALVSQAQ